MASQTLKVKLIDLIKDGVSDCLKVKLIDFITNRLSGCFKVKLIDFIKIAKITLFSENLKISRFLLFGWNPDFDRFPPFLLKSRFCQISPFWVILTKFSNLQHFHWETPISRFWPFQHKILNQSRFYFSEWIDQILKFPEFSNFSVKFWNSLVSECLGVDPDFQDIWFETPWRRVFKFKSKFKSCNAYYRQRQWALPGCQSTKNPMTSIWAALAGSGALHTPFVLYPVGTRHHASAEVLGRYRIRTRMNSKTDVLLFGCQARI